MSTYVIREKYFGYNDEVFYVAGHRIANVFEDKTQAEVEYKQVEIASARDFPLYEVESLFDATEEELQKLDDFVFSRCGVHILGKYGAVSEGILPDCLNDEDTFEFIQLAKMQKFQLVKFEHEVKFYGLWSVKNQQWLQEHDEFSASLVYVEEQDQLKNKVEAIFADYDYAEINLEGSLEELSNHPVLLQALIATESGLSYDETKKVLTIGEWEDVALYAINPLLKQPLFEIKEISLEEIQTIEKELAKQYNCDEDDWGKRIG
ncbi:MULTISPECIES: hypothetical protein [Acinetobacter]|jgi:hypothetical protein|uniref:hypothetical protein n=1 Tax=Acinetobacter TaxID=469 RepID=UPI000C5A2A70|nr:MULTISPECIES: hypothetical protein [Acinetobacter]MEC8568298.1 hypothetical protein [Pseudomonadota bacterium]MBC69305.1 hypothetical protein [Acinetobacter sp.]MBT48738.1 hypothetical protein [Acinetobacter sp.]HIQ34374.1 hypothetical protein [Acinetobacter venetianus]HJP48952.1 hypothetical protein [Acinetobacter venetianus]